MAGLKGIMGTKPQLEAKQRLSPLTIFFRLTAMGIGVVGIVFTLLTILGNSGISIRAHAGTPTKRFVSDHSAALSYFYGTCTEDGTVELSWATHPYHGQVTFVLERSADGNTFHSLAHFPNVGQRQDKQHYHFLDTNPFAEGYYRLKQSHAASKTIYGPIISVSTQPSALPNRLF